MFDYMHEAFNANSKYRDYNNLKKLEHIIGKKFDDLFPPMEEDKDGKRKMAKLIQEPDTERKMLTKELWDEKYEFGRATCKEKYTLAACIFPGFIDQESDFTLCAYSEDSYVKFKDLFDKFIVDGPKQIEFVSGGYQNIIMKESDSKKIKKIKLTVRRNFKQFPLCPGMSKDQKI